MSAAPPYCCRSFGIAQTSFGLSSLSLQHRTMRVLIPPATKIAPDKLELFWCRGRESNPHMVAHTGF
ncbi:MAG: hypothetical protein UY76_C0063G0004 [Candidatus Uhrbacteria bacterium GW2011_GWA2_52_8d]|uniref:Uncharacterized protein n=1 Tax=Candidatus Uhrbacteria bacterium GW2011_GWA2_52_8d TaxID=1618979 RepID=A0A0G1XK41_9BACT|nr:MAG: hypothetical protein UY76_C0063G0004 [Candidatus Uhrbacteria bacterium GW2011_GWA2_52_8d]